jgi:hypothetical protein
VIETTLAYRVLTARSLDDLAAVNIDDVPSGALCYVTDQQQTYHLDKDSAATASSPQVIAARTGGPFPNARWSRFQDYSAAQAYYVAKHGNDANTGLSPGAAKLTIASAVSAASAQTPSSTNRFVVRILDAGIYEENVTLPDWVSLDGTDAKVLGDNAAAAALSIGDDCEVKLREIEGLASQVVILKGATTTGTSKVDADRVVVADSGLGAINLGTSSGVLFYLVRTTTVGASAVGVGDISTGFGHLHIWCEDIYLAGAGATAVARLGGSSIVGRVSHILEIGSGIGAGTGINVAGGAIELVVGELIATAAYTVAAGALLRLWVNQISGTETETGSGQALVTVAGLPDRDQVMSDELASDQNDYGPDAASVSAPNRVGWSDATLVRLSVGAANRTITGFAAVTRVGRKTIVKADAANNLVISNDSASSSAANRVLTNTGADLTLAQNEMAILIRDPVTDRWRAYKA